MKRNTKTPIDKGLKWFRKVRSMKLAMEQLWNMEEELDT